MDEKALFTKFWTDEAETTRKVLGRITTEPSTFQTPSRTMKWTGNPSATTPWTTSGTFIAYASPPDPMKNATSPVQTQYAALFMTTSTVDHS